MILQVVSIIIEAIIVVFSLLTAIKKKKIYGFGIALTFAIYVFYDLARSIPLSISNNILYPLFFIATLSALWAIWMIYRER